MLPQSTPQLFHCPRCNGDFSAESFPSSARNRRCYVCSNCLTTTPRCTRCQTVITRTGKSGLCRSCVATISHTISDPVKHFWSKVAIKSVDECWTWQRGRTPTGYGQFRVDKTPISAHRFAWSLVHGTIPKGMFICHTCDNPPCCNPSHLFLGTPKDNVIDMTNKGRRGYGASGLRGERHGNAILTESNIKEMRTLRESGSSLMELALRYNIARSTVSDICLRKAWKHVL